MGTRPADTGLEIHVHGLVQGVGFRPTMWRLARECGLKGHVFNNGGGVTIRIWGDKDQVAVFLAGIEAEPPPLARIDAVTTSPYNAPPLGTGFHILPSEGGEIQTGVAADAAICADCQADIEDPKNRRYRYPFTNCTHCGPRLSIIRTIPYDRIHTAMAEFAMCDRCQAEYDDPADRRFHAQPNACPECGPQVWLEDRQGRLAEPGGHEDSLALTSHLIRQGHIIAIKGIGGFHLVCDATNAKAVEALRQRKQRHDKPFALMARDGAMIGRYADLGADSLELLHDKAAPIVLLPKKQNGKTLARNIAPGQNRLGFMLPYTPLHHILMAGLECPIVMTSGNRSEEPQCISNNMARRQLATIADYWLMHDRDIINRLDDSVIRMVDRQAQTLRRARGFAPSPIRLPEGLGNVPPVLAMGAELKNTFCLIRNGEALISQHIGNLQDVATHEGYRESLDLYGRLYAFKASIISVDMHPGYHSTQWGEKLASQYRLPIDKVQHHHAHIAAVLAEHGRPVDAQPVLGIVLDGLGFGDDGGLWGGEFLLADYHTFKRLAHIVPVPLIGGDKAMHEPWRNAYAHLDLAFGWDNVSKRYPQLEIIRYLKTKSLQAIDIMVKRGLNAPSASSTGRLFDAVAATLGLRQDKVSYEGQAAIELEAMAAGCNQEQAGQYDVDVDASSPMNWRLLWQGMVDDLQKGVESEIIAMRFHNTLAWMIGQKAVYCNRDQAFKTIALCGGVFQNSLLLQAVSRHLQTRGFEVLVPSKIPANDGGISLGQAVVTAARKNMPGKTPTNET